MTPVPTDREAVERLADRLDRTPLHTGGGEASDMPEEAAATLRALRAALDAAEQERDAALAAVEAARREEMEAAAKTVEGSERWLPWGAREQLASAIRARGEAKEGT
jgi:hypothetical protein